MIAGSDARQGRPGLALAAGTDDQHLVVGQTVGIAFVEERWHVGQIAVLAGSTLDAPQGSPG